MVIQSDVIALLRTVGLDDDIRRSCLVCEGVKEGSGWFVEQRYVSMKIK
jgi:hypothetical protein